MALLGAGVLCPCPQGRLSSLVKREVFLSTTYPRWAAIPQAPSDCRFQGEGSSGCQNSALMRGEGCRGRERGRWGLSQRPKFLI